MGLITPPMMIVCDCGCGTEARYCDDQDWCVVIPPGVPKHDSRWARKARWYVDETHQAVGEAKRLQASKEAPPATG